MTPLSQAHAFDIHGWLRPRKPGWGGALMIRTFPRRDVVLGNIATVFPSLSPEERLKLGALFCENLLASVRENLFFRFLSDDALKRTIRIEGVEKLTAAYDRGDGVLICTAHFGNWERSPVAAIQHYPEYKGRFHFMRRPIGNAFVERTLFSRFYKAGLGIIPKRNSMSRVLDALSKKEVVVFIMDQYAKTSKEGIDVEFFGRPAGTFRSLALVAKRSGAPVVPSYSYRAADGTHVMEFFDALEWIEHDDSDEEIRLNTRAYSAAIERMVLAHPDQWWWPHRRWKRK